MALEQGPDQPENTALQGPGRRLCQRRCHVAIRCRKLRPQRRERSLPLRTAGCRRHAEHGGPNRACAGRLRRQSPLNKERIQVTSESGEGGGQLRRTASTTRTTKTATTKQRQRKRQRRPRKPRRQATDEQRLPRLTTTDTTKEHLQAGTETN